MQLTWRYELRQLRTRTIH